VSTQYAEAHKSTQGERSLFDLGKETEDPAVKYLIVHKLLVLDSWLNLGQAVTLQDAITRYEQLSAGGAEMVESLRRAAGNDESEEDVFVLL
jgi:hypothetical protein